MTSVYANEFKSCYTLMAPNLMHYTIPENMLDYESTFSL